MAGVDVKGMNSKFDSKDTYTNPVNTKPPLTRRFKTKEEELEFHKQQYIKYAMIAKHAKPADEKVEKIKHA